MLTVVIPKTELFDEKTDEFKYFDGCTLLLEHSLISLSKWESVWQKPFLSKESKSNEETLDYIKHMTLTRGVPPETYLHIPDAVLQEINEYIAAPMTATTFTNKDPVSGREVVTAEIIYYWMVTFNIPVDFEKWHLNRLLTLIRVCNIKNSTPKKQGIRETLQQYHDLNAQRRAAMGTKG